MNCCETHASELRCDYCPWCKIEELEAENQRPQDELKHYKRALRDGALEYINDVLEGDEKIETIIRDWFNRTGWLPPELEGGE